MARIERRRRVSHSAPWRSQRGLRDSHHGLLVIALDKLIDLKRAAGRPKDLESIAELERIQGESTS